MQKLRWHGTCIAAELLSGMCSLVACGIARVGPRDVPDWVTLQETPAQDADQKASHPRSHVVSVVALSTSLLKPL